MESRFKLDLSDAVPDSVPADSTHLVMELIMAEINSKVPPGTPAHLIEIDSSRVRETGRLYVTVLTEEEYLRKHLWLRPPDAE